MLLWHLFTIIDIVYSKGVCVVYVYVNKKTYNAFCTCQTQILQSVLTMTLKLLILFFVKDLERYLLISL